MSFNWDEVDSDVESLTLENKIVTGKVVSVYDGDSCKCVFPFEGKLYKWTCRIDGIDTPELRTRSKLEKEAGYKARDFLRSKILKKVVEITCGKFDKYGRLLVRIKYEGEDISDLMVANNHAFSYDGGKKRSWAEYLKNQNTSNP